MSNKYIDTICRCPKHGSVNRDICCPKTGSKNLAATIAKPAASALGAMVVMFSVLVLTAGKR
jgi:hypothetical protein